MGFLLERFYSEGYSMKRFYQGTITVSTISNSIRGEGKIEQEKYSDMIQCGFFSLITLDDAADDFFEKLGPGHTVMQGVDQ